MGRVGVSWGFLGLKVYRSTYREGIFILQKTGKVASLVFPRQLYSAKLKLNKAANCPAQNKDHHNTACVQDRFLAFSVIVKVNCQLHHIPY